MHQAVVKAPTTRVTSQFTDCSIAQMTDFERGKFMPHEATLQHFGMPRHCTVLALIKIELHLSNSVLCASSHGYTLVSAAKTQYPSDPFIRNKAQKCSNGSG